ncbi:MAG: hypothetical protein KDD48_04645 [Bdellovibrionales bacterium]|nr:hypothetical protein [Bdellovibrionales bacterium]
MIEVSRIIICVVFLVKSVAFGVEFIEIPWELGKGQEFQQRRIENYYEECVQKLFVTGVSSLEGTHSKWGAPDMKWTLRNDRKRLVFFKHIDQISVHGGGGPTQLDEVGYKTLLLSDSDFSKLMKGQLAVPSEYKKQFQVNKFFKVSSKMVESRAQPSNKELEELGIEIKEEESDTRFDHFIVVRDRFYFDVEDPKSKDAVIVGGDVILRQLVIKKTEGHYRNAYAWGLYCEFDGHDLDRYKPYLEVILEEHLAENDASSRVGSWFKESYINLFRTSKINNETVQQIEGSSDNGFMGHFLDPAKVTDGSGQTLAVIQGGRIVAEKNVQEQPNDPRHNCAYNLSARIEDAVTKVLKSKLFIVDSSVDLSRMDKSPF